MLHLHGLLRELYKFLISFSFLPWFYSKHQSPFYIHVTVPTSFCTYFQSCIHSQKCDHNFFFFCVFTTFFFFLLPELSFCFWILNAHSNTDPLLFTCWNVLTLLFIKLSNFCHMETLFHQLIMVCTSCPPSQTRHYTTALHSVIGHLTCPPCSLHPFPNQALFRVRRWGPVQPGHHDESGTRRAVNRRHTTRDFSLTLDGSPPVLPPTTKCRKSSSKKN